jgi:hypothetical protein
LCASPGSRFTAMMTILIVWPLGMAALFFLQREKAEGSE